MKMKMETEMGMDNDLEPIKSEQSKKNILKMRMDSMNLKKQNLINAERRSDALKSPLLGASETNKRQSPCFSDEEDLAAPFLQESHSLANYNAQSKDFDGTIKRYSRPIKLNQIEKVSKFVLFKAAKQYFGDLYAQHLNIRDIVEKKMKQIQIECDQIKFQIETTD